MRITTTLLLGPLLVLGLAACGAAGGGSETAGAGASSGASADPKGTALKFAQCMRDNGLPDFPDPEFGDNGELSQSAPGNVDKAQLDAAQEKCKEFAPDSGPPKPMDPEKLAKAREYSKCMRDHGFPDFPDPDANGGIAIQGGPEMDPMSPGFKSTEQNCAQQYLPGGGGTRSEKQETGK
jgi:hypothetical protein